jgi:hypothetical protein
MLGRVGCWCRNLNGSQQLFDHQKLTRVFTAPTEEIQWDTALRLLANFNMHLLHSRATGVPESASK